MRRSIALVLTSTLVFQALPLLAAQAPVVPGSVGSTVATAAPGTVAGTAQSAAGQILPRQAVQIRNLQTGQLAGSTTSNAAGGFTFSGLAPADYVVELVNSSGAVVGSSASIAVGAGQTSTMTVALTTAATRGAAATAGMAGVTKALIVTGIAATAGIAGAVIVADDASPSR